MLTPKSCDKATRLLCLCDAFSIPVVFLLDTPGFLVGTDVEHEGLVPKAVAVPAGARPARRSRS